MTIRVPLIVKFEVKHVEFFLAFDFFVSSAWSIGFFIPATTANDLRLRKDFNTRSSPLHYYLILILEKEPVFPLLNVQCRARELLVPFL